MSDQHPASRSSASDWNTNVAAAGKAVKINIFKKKSISAEGKKWGMWIWEIWHPYTNRLPDLGEGSKVIRTNTLVTIQTLLLTSRSKGYLRMSALWEEETGFTALCYSWHIQRTRSTGGFCGYANTDQGISWLYSLKFAPDSNFFLPVIMTIAKGRSALMGTQLIPGKVSWSPSSTARTTAVFSVTDTEVKFSG